MAVVTRFIRHATVPKTMDVVAQFIGHAMVVVARFIGQNIQGYQTPRSSCPIYWAEGPCKMRAIKNVRLKHYDYSTNGYYFVTICTNRKRPYLNTLKQMIQYHINELNDLQGVSIDYYNVMPDHVHLIVGLTESPWKLGDIIRRFKAKSSRLVGLKLWQPNYYEHVIRDEKALLKIREYIQNNPLAEQLKIEEIY